MKIKTKKHQLYCSMILKRNFSLKGACGRSYDATFTVGLNPDAGLYHMIWPCEILIMTAPVLVPCPSVFPVDVSPWLCCRQVGQSVITGVLVHKNN